VNQLGAVSAKFVAVIFILAFIAVGAIGLVMPLLPGVLFLALAGLLLARHFPSVDAWLRRNEQVSRHLDDANGFLDLPLPQKARLAAWYGAKMLLATATVIVAAARTLVQRLARV
jgi:uncharacterized membrane protein YbaN (DUF454 family)